MNTLKIIGPLDDLLLSYFPSTLVSSILPHRQEVKWFVVFPWMYIVATVLIRFFFFLSFFFLLPGFLFKYFQSQLIVRDKFLSLRVLFLFL